MKHKKSFIQKKVDGISYQLNVVYRPDKELLITDDYLMDCFYSIEFDV